ncbi:hypothetical protein B0T17DRAFT_505339 [Bombardia bombarda]|uniref:EGF-like domain-containing protein n=1 Tax=Bombardia bombarda TaxID=252184 RepID=A0AA39X7E4_9PEZI|nr:hypothetical protein B0T17DRAFT_505339 [Bombardia bombarda]
MDRPPPAGSVRRAREHAAARLQNDRSLAMTMSNTADEEPQIARPSVARPTGNGPTAGQIRAPRPPAPYGLQTKDGQIGVAISKPTQMPQWPLQAPILAPMSSGAEPYRPPPGKSQRPQRPPRPSRVPSILDGSKLQDHTPVFQYRPQSTGQELLSVPETPPSVSQQSTQSSVGSIPDFPLPARLPPITPGPPRRSVNLGPPPSARRGVSSFYSNVSFVSPIPEESPRSRSHTSFASSAAIPDSWGSPSPGQSPNYPDAFYDERIAEESGLELYGDDDAEESRLVRSASLGKMARPTLVDAPLPRALERGEYNQRPGPAPFQAEPFRNGTGYVENSSSSSTLPMIKQLLGSSRLPDAIYPTESATDPSSPSSRDTPSPQPPYGGRRYSRLSAIRRPPRLDLDAVTKAESRGSLTSLPDLIRRATRLAASLENGRRPASRFEESGGQDDYGREKDMSLNAEKHQSGLSEMLAAFPPPAQPVVSRRRSIRNSIREQVQSWPLPFNSNRSANPSEEEDAVPNSDSQPSTKRGRRCCGLPLWGFIVVMIVVLLLIAAAVVIPLEFLVIRKQNVEKQAQAALQQCQLQLICANGGTNVVNQGTCSCICTNGFTGFDCTVSSTTGCTTVSLAGDNAINDVTIGTAIPRLIQSSQSNFSISLSATDILAKFNSGNLSCLAENALVTFDGESVRQGDALARVSDSSSDALNVANVVDGVALVTITIMAGQSTTITLPFSPATTQSGSQQPASGSGFSTIVTAPSTFATTLTVDKSSSSSVPSSESSATTTSTVTTTMSMSSGAPAPTATFAVTEEVLDFARVAVLFMLQEENLSVAKDAQSTLQKFFTSASKVNSQVSSDTARNVTVGNGNSVDLVDFRVDVGSFGGVFGGRTTHTRRPAGRGARLKAPSYEVMLGSELVSQSADRASGMVCYIHPIRVTVGLFGVDPLNSHVAEAPQHRGGPIGRFRHPRLPPSNQDFRLRYSDRRHPRALSPQKAENQVIKVECPGCPILVEGHGGQKAELQTDKKNHLELSFSIDHQPESDRLLLNGFELYPSADPFHDILWAPLSLDKKAVKVDGDEDRPGRSTPPPFRPHGSKPQHLGYSLRIHPVAQDEGSQLELIALDLQIIEVGTVFIDGIPNVHVKLIKDPSGKLLIGDIETTTSETLQKTPLDKQQDECITLMCKCLAIVQDKIKNMRRPGKPCHGMMRGGGLPAASSDGEEEVQSKEAQVGKDGDHPAPPSGHWHKEHRPPHHPHHRFHFDGYGPRRTWGQFFKNTALNILLGTVVGLTFGLIAAVISSFFPESDDEKEADFVEEEKAGLMEHQDPPPSYEAPQEEEEEEDVKKATV